MNQLAAWYVNLDYRIQLNQTPPASEPQLLSACGCRGERLAFQFCVSWKGNPATVRVRTSELKGSRGMISSSAWQIHFADFVHTQEVGLVADPLHMESHRLLHTDRIQPIWVFCDLPDETSPGHYEGEIHLCCSGEQVVIQVRIKVLSATLPTPCQRSFYLDLWQHPASVARYHRVAPWSESHWCLIRQYLRLLASGSQKPITACIIEDPWASQTFDPYHSMVEWRRLVDGSLSFDFTIFDRYVELCRDIGLTGPINCYSVSMGPGDRMDCPIRYWDDATSQQRSLDCKVGDETYRQVWGAFFDAFTTHLDNRGWLQQTCIAIDEAPEQKMQELLKIIPEIYGITLAGNFHPDLEPRIHDYSIIYPGAPSSIADSRRKAGKITTFYTCCGPEYPNTFTFSPPVESRILGWQALAIHADGYLRWAFNSWPSDPFETSDYGAWPSGDTFLIYPGPVTSIRFEMLKLGIQDFEAWHLANRLVPEDPRLPEAVRLANQQHNGRLTSGGPLETARGLVNQVLEEIS